jgi:hypothetical protein
MKMLHFLSILIMLSFATMTSSCGTSTYITQSWKKPGVTSSDYNNIFITSITADTSLRRVVEDEIGDEIEASGKTVTKSIDAFPEDVYQPNKEIVFNAIKKYNPDLILTIATIGQETEPRYASDRFYGYFEGWSRRVNSAGYYTDDKVYYLQTNLFNAATEELVWATTSESYNPKSLQNFLKSYKKAMKKQMKKDGFIE